ncbi:MAG: Ig-like domain-containing protein [Prevotella sp.]|nr:Ig-like domain-containing protein [Prevotella sp.]
MIKHLRFFMLNLLVLVSAAVMAQTTVDFSNGLPSDWTKLAGTVAKQTYEGKTAIQLQKGASISSPAMAEAATELVVTTTRSSKGTTMTVAYKIGEADAVVFKTFNATEVAKASWAEYTVEVPKEAQVAGCKYIFTTNTASYYISQIEFVATGASKKTETTTTFGEDTDGATFIFSGDEAPVGKTASVTPAEALNSSNGKLTYKSDHTDIVAVDETTGALTWGTNYGTAKITATYTAAEGALFKDSEAFYYVKHKRAADPTKVIFDANEGAFDCFGNENKYKDGEFDFVDLNGDSYTFTVRNAMLNNYGGGLQLKKNSTSDPTAQGYAISPAFDKFPNGYRVTVKYKDQNAPELECTNHAEDVAVSDDANGTMYMDVPFADGMFKLSGASQVAYVQSIELTPLAKKEPQPVTMTFPQDVYTCYTNEAPLFDGFTPTIKNAAGEVLNLPVTYTSSNTDFCMVTSSGTVRLSQNPGEVTITAKFAGNDDYLPAEASYLIRVIEKEKAEAGIAFEETMQLVDLAKKTITAEELGFKNPNNLAVTYSSNKTDVAEVDAEGNVTLKKAGRVNIDVTFAGNDEYKAATASCTLIVNDYRNTPELAFDQEEYTANMREGNTFSGATLYNKSEVAPLTYTSSNEEVAEVAANGVVILRSTGETTITVWFAGDNDFKATSASYKLTVIDEVVNGIQNITIDNMPEDAKVYNLNGQRMNAKALKSGVYVVNGKKVVLK